MAPGPPVASMDAPPSYAQSTVSHHYNTKPGVIPGPTPMFLPFAPAGCCCCVECCQCCRDCDDWCHQCTQKNCSPGCIGCMSWVCLCIPWVVLPVAVVVANVV